MINTKLGNNILILFIAVISFTLAIQLHRSSPMPRFDLEMQDKAININQDMLRIFSLGNKRLISNLIWVQTLLQSDEVQYRRGDKKNWMYLRFKTIAELDPLFYHNYLWGGTYLSIIKDDIHAATEIFDQGLHFYPDDFELNYRQGFNYYFEAGEFQKGLKHLEKIEHYPQTPHPIKLVINKLRFETSFNYDVALSYLFVSLQKEKDPVLIKKLSNDFYALKAERDLKCLNANEANCDRKDAEGNWYIKVNQDWKAPKEFKPYRIHLPNRDK